MKDLTKISDILSDTVFDKKKCTNSIKKGVAFGFWKDICGSRFMNFSMPYDIKGKTLFVSVKNPQVMQELLFYKESLLSKIKDYFLPLNIEIEEIRYDYKTWSYLNKSKTVIGDETLEYYTNDEVEEVALNRFEKEELMNVTNTISNMSFLDDRMKEKYSKNIINSIKVRKLRGK